jgi:UDP-N-acetylglucosamine 1-carboxyvinyltransferase
MAAVAACGGSVYLQGVTPSLCRGFLDVFTGMGMDIRMEGEAMLVQMYHRPVNIHKICTGAYPDFPTDMQSMVLSVASVGEGTLILKEQIFENRFKTVPWLKKMGADITLSGDSVLVKGVETLKGSEVYGEDLRGTAALIIAGLAAQETTVIHDADYILRGYMDLCENLKGLGAEIEWENS